MAEREERLPGLLRQLDELITEYDEASAGVQVHVESRPEAAVRSKEINAREADLRRDRLARGAVQQVHLEPREARWARARLP